MASICGCTGISLKLGQEQVLRDVSIDVHERDVVAIVGASGSGKSTLLHCLSGILLPDAGTVSFAGERIERLPDKDRSRLRLERMGFVFQFGELIPELTLVENVEMPLLLRGDRPAAARAAAMEWLARLDIAGHADKRTSEVSGGQAQRAALCRAVVHGPDVLFADEPTGSLDSVSGNLALDTLLTLTEEESLTLVIVTHDESVAARASRVVRMIDGRLDERGSQHGPAGALAGAGR